MSSPDLLFFRAACVLLFISLVHLAVSAVRLFQLCLRTLPRLSCWLSSLFGFLPKGHGKWSCVFACNACSSEKVKSAKTSRYIPAPGTRSSFCFFGLGPVVSHFTRSHKNRVWNLTPNMSDLSFFARFCEVNLHKCIEEQIINKPPVLYRSSSISEVLQTDWHK